MKQQHKPQQSYGGGGGGYGGGGGGSSYGGGGGGYGGGGGGYEQQPAVSLCDLILAIDAETEMRVAAGAVRVRLWIR